MRDIRPKRLAFPRFAVLLALLFASILCAAEGAKAELSSQGQIIALKGCALIDGTGAAPIANAVILVRDGIINAHVHAAFDEARLKEWAAAGVTSVRDMASFGESIEEVTRWREESRKRSELARLFVVGPMISAPGGYGSLFVDSPDASRAAVAALSAAGVDAIKTSLEDG